MEKEVFIESITFQGKFECIIKYREKLGKGNFLSKELKINNSNRDPFFKQFWDWMAPNSSIGPVMLREYVMGKIDYNSYNYTDESVMVEVNFK